MKIIVNGNNEEIEESSTLNSLIEKFSLNKKKIIALMNEDVIKEDRYESLLLNDGDKIELLSIVGGG